jgi:hypothetical protein
MSDFYKDFPIRNTEEDTKLEFYASLINYLKKYNMTSNIKFKNPLFEYRRTDLVLVGSNLTPVLVIEFKGDYGTCTQAWDQLKEYARVVPALYYACIIGYSLQEYYQLQIASNNDVKNYTYGLSTPEFFKSMNDVVNSIFKTLKPYQTLTPIDKREYERHLRNEASLKFELGRVLRENGFDVAVEYGLMRPMLFNYSNRVDLAIIKGNSVIPIEVKAKKPGIKGFSQINRYTEVFNSHIGVLAYYDNYGATLELYTEQNYKDFHIKFSDVNGLKLINNNDLLSFVDYISIVSK